MIKVEEEHPINTHPPCGNFTIIEESNLFHQEPQTWLAASARVAQVGTSSSQHWDEHVKPKVSSTVPVSTQLLQSSDQEVLRPGTHAASSVGKPASPFHRSTCAWYLAAAPVPKEHTMPHAMTVT